MKDLSVSPIPVSPVLNVDPAVTSARFTARSLSRAVPGTIPVRSAGIEVDEAGRPVSVTAELDLAGIDTGNPRRDKDLRSKRFFDTDRTPHLRFSSTSVTDEPDGWRVTGTLTTGERRCEVVLSVRRTGPDGFTATGTLDRRDFGIKAPPFLIGRNVTLEIVTKLLQPA
jgi:polyisoprenoid-binding protein YceI